MNSIIHLSLQLIMCPKLRCSWPKHTNPCLRGFTLELRSFLSTSSIMHTVLSTPLPCPFFVSQLFLLVILVQCNFTVGTRNVLSLLTSVCSLCLRLNLGMHLDLVRRQNLSKLLANLNKISSFFCHSCNSYRIRRVRKPGDTSAIMRSRILVIFSICATLW